MVISPQTYQWIQAVCYHASSLPTRSVGLPFAMSRHGADAGDVLRQDGDAAAIATGSYSIQASQILVRQ